MGGTMKNTIRAVIFGHAIGDALGVPVEFCDRAELCRMTVTDYQGYGLRPVPAVRVTADRARLDQQPT